MLVIKDVKVHEDTHVVLKLIKTQNRNKSMDEVIRELVKKGTGKVCRAILSAEEERKADELPEVAIQKYRAGMSGLANGKVRRYYREEASHGRGEGE